MAAPTDKRTSWNKKKKNDEEEESKNEQKQSKTKNIISVSKIPAPGKTNALAFPS